MIQFLFAAFNAVLNGSLAVVAYAHGHFELAMIAAFISGGTKCCGHFELAMIAAFISGGTSVAAISYLAIR